jgi:hypothetical protein
VHSAIKKEKSKEKKGHRHVHRHNNLPHSFFYAGRNVPAAISLH